MSKSGENALNALNEALVLLRQDKEITADELSGAVGSVVGRKCRAVFEPCRHEVILARDWNFTRQFMWPTPRYDERRMAWATAVPDGTMKVTSVFGCDGRQMEDGWSVVSDGTLLSEKAVSRIEIVEDVKDVGRWPVLVRRALVYALARDLAIPVTGRNADLQNMNALYLDKLKQAALHDARQDQPGRDAWGRNEYAERIRGAIGSGADRSARARRVI